MRKINLSVANFLHYKNYFLFIKRSDDLKVMPGQVNGIGGKVEVGEDYISACIRETKEETGIEIIRNQIKFCGFISFENDSVNNWLTAFFKIKLKNKFLPRGIDSKEGRLMWILEDKVLQQKDRADDLNLIWKDITKGKLFFLNCRVKDNNFKIYKTRGEVI